MSERIQKALDGELPTERLTKGEQREVAACREAVGAAVAAAERAAARPSPDVTVAVMTRIRGLSPDGSPAAGEAGAPAARAPSALRAALAWLLTPQPVRLRPVAALGVLVLIAGALAVAAPERSTGGVTATDDVPRLLVQFRISTEGARDVALVGDFSGWEGRPLEEVSPGVWTTTVALEPGLYDYAFVIDGERWQLDPLAPAVADGFGGANSRIAVLAPEVGP